MLSIVIAGFSDEYGSWKTTWMSVASLRRRLREMLLIVSPRKVIAPPVTGARPRMARPMVVLPEPDSPTRLSVSPAARSKETPSDHAGLLTPPARKRDLEVLDLEDRVSARGAGVVGVGHDTSISSTRRDDCNSSRVYSCCGDSKI